MNDIKRIREIVKDNIEEIRFKRRHIHQYPDLSFEENKTAKFIIKYLKKCGIEYRYPVAKTGVIGYLRCNNWDKRVVALRADMDALPVSEETCAEYSSKKGNIMHACGHDVHVACLLGVVMVLSSIKSEIEGTIVFIFQPAEEKNPGGAIAMIKARALKNPKPDVILGQHVDPSIPIGSIATKAGKLTAVVDTLTINIKGKGGHGAYPHNTIDPILIGSQIILSLQQIVSRNVDSNEPMVLTFGSIHAGEASNVIPETCQIKGTLRSVSQSWRELAHKQINLIAQGVAHGSGGSVEVKIDEGYPSVDNEFQLTKRVVNSAKEYLGLDKVLTLTQKMGGEDFSYYQKEIPGVFYCLGVRNEEQNIINPLHSPKFDVDEDCLEIGTGTMAWLTLKELMNLNDG